GEQQGILEIDRRRRTGFVVAARDIERRGHRDHKHDVEGQKFRTGKIEWKHSVLPLMTAVQRVGTRGWPAPAPGPALAPHPRPRTCPHALRPDAPRRQPTASRTIPQLPTAPRPRPDSARPRAPTMWRRSPATDRMCRRESVAPALADGR